jgi:bifunctional non-homologous end joining protein LigD
MKTETSRRVFRERRYVMKKHLATRLHYDLRLEWNRVLLSWALPEGPSCHAGVIREAIEMPDHRMSYLQFEGIHETGPIMLWDRGTWEPHPESDDIESGLRRGILQLTFHGERLKGGWTLTRTNTTKNGHPVWTLCKHADAFAETHIHRHLSAQWLNSVSTGRTMEQIVRDWTRRKNNPGQMELF